MASDYTTVNVQVGKFNVPVKKAGQGQPLIYLHGAFGYKGWPSFLKRLADSFSVYAPPHPGFTEEDGIADIDDILDLTLYHFDLLEALELHRPFLVGHHIGGMMAAEMAALRPSQLPKIVLAAPTGLWLDEQPGVDYFATPANELRSILFSDPDSPVSREAMPDPASDDDRAEQNIDRVRSLSAVGKFLWPIPDKGLKKRLRRIKAPTLVITGTDDKIVPPAYGDAFAESIPGAELAKLSNVGHLMMLERPEEFSDMVVKFLGS